MKKVINISLRINDKLNLASAYNGIGDVYVLKDMIKKYEEVMEEYNALVYAAAERFNKENQ